MSSSSSFQRNNSGNRTPIGGRSRAPPGVRQGSQSSLAKGGSSSQPSTPKIGASLETFLKEAESIQRNIDRAAGNVAQIEQLHSKSMYAMGRDELANITARLDEIQDKTNSMLQELKSRLKSVSGYIKRLPAGDANIAKSRQAGLARKLQDTAEDYQSIQVKYKQKYREKIEREIRIAKPDASQQEIDAALDSNTGNVFSQQLLSGRVDAQRKVLQQVQSRHEELKRLEESIEQLFNLYQDMQLLIESQQEVFDKIEANIGNTEQHLESGTKEIGKAITYRVNARKRAWWIFGIVLVLIIVAVILFYFLFLKDYLAKQNSSSSSSASTATASR